MGKTSAELQREIAAYRARMESRVRHLEDRVRSDVREAGSTVKRDVTERVDVKRYIEERPLTTLLGAFGAGVALGIASDRAPRARHGGRGRRGRRRGQRDSDDGGGLFDELLGTVSGTMSGSLRDEVKRFVDELFGERPGGQRDSARGAYEPDEDRRFVGSRYDKPGEYYGDRRPYRREDEQRIGRIEYEAKDEQGGAAPFSAGRGDYRFAPGDTADRAGERSPLGDYDTSPYADEEGLNEYGYDPAEERLRDRSRTRRRA